MNFIILRDMSGVPVIVNLNEVESLYPNIDRTEIRFKSGTPIDVKDTTTEIIGILQQMLNPVQPEVKKDE